ncbi:hypothetical protein V8G54_010590, partial [Vigna mungo]
TIAHLPRLFSYVPGLYKISDEILVNIVDNKQRDPSMATLKVTIDAKQNTISVFNNGDAIPVEIPNFICGHLLTNSNYDDNVKKTTGGRNGYSAKLTNIFSTEFIVKIADGKRKKKYKQLVFSSHIATFFYSLPVILLTFLRTQFCLIGTSKESSSVALVGVGSNSIGVSFSFLNLVRKQKVILGIAKV